MNKINQELDELKKTNKILEAENNTLLMTIKELE